MQTIDHLITHADSLITCARSDGQSGPSRGAGMLELGIIQNGALAIDQGKIVDLGPSDELQTRFQPKEQISAKGKALIPGFVDPHTHVVYGGDRIAEFEQRIAGASYLEILQSGGGIHSSVEATRNASEQELIEQSRARLDQMLRHGTTTAEVKTGYGLSLESELKMLRAIEALDKSHVIDLIPTFLAAHAIPQEYKEKPDAYVEHVVQDMLPQAAKWYQKSHFSEQQVPFFNDVFCEKGALDLQQSTRVLEAGLSRGIKAKVHADEFTSMGAVPMGIQVGATSIDHLDVTTAEDQKALAQSDSIGVLLPAVNFNLGSTEFADGRSLIDAGAAVALSTDINPGSAPGPSMPLVMAIACRYQKLMPAEALLGSTRNAAYAIGLGERCGSLEIGKQADFLILNTPDYRHLSYTFGGNFIESVYKNGQRVQG